MIEDNSLSNFDDDEEDDIEVEDGDFSDNAVLYGTDWTVKTIIQQIEDGNIDLSPNFQRRDAWSSKNKHKFIESVALQFPIPQIVLAEKKDQRGTYIVLDGKQRLITLTQFAANLDPDHPVVHQSRSKEPLKLAGLKLLSKLNGKTYKDIDNDESLKAIKTKFDNHSIRSAIIRNWPNDDYLYEVFVRLNTGSSKLSPQELRQAMKPGEFTEFLSLESSNSIALQKILGIEAPDFRMRDVDLLLRMIAFSLRLKDYGGDLKKFLDGTHDLLNSEWSFRGDSIALLVRDINDAIDFLIRNFENPLHVGRKIKNGEFESQINRALLDVQLASVLPRGNRDKIERIGLKIKDITENLCKNDFRFIQSISSTTKSKTAVNDRFCIWKKEVEACLGESIEMNVL